VGVCIHVGVCEDKDKCVSRFYQTKEAASINHPKDPPTIQPTHPLQLCAVVQLLLRQLVAGQVVKRRHLHLRPRRLWGPLRAGAATWPLLLVLVLLLWRWQSATAGVWLPLLLRLEALAAKGGVEGRKIRRHRAAAADGARGGRDPGGCGGGRGGSMSEGIVAAVHWCMGAWSASRMGMPASRRAQMSQTHSMLFSIDRWWKTPPSWLSPDAAADGGTTVALPAPALPLHWRLNAGCGCGACGGWCCCLSVWT
jgi:hypothetical protein